jgi:hypothetical protein
MAQKAKPKPKNIDAAEAAPIHLPHPRFTKHPKTSRKPHLQGDQTIAETHFAAIKPQKVRPEAGNTNQTKPRQQSNIRGRRKPKKIIH